jgi:hypothetical protein
MAWEGCRVVSEDDDFIQPVGVPSKTKSEALDIVASAA